MGASAVAVYEGEAGRLYHHVKPGEEEVLRQRGLQQRGQQGAASSATLLIGLSKQLTGM